MGREGGGQKELRKREGEETFVGLEKQTSKQKVNYTSKNLCERQNDVYRVRDGGVAQPYLMKWQKP